jgi:hypothetical protein
VQQRQPGKIPRQGWYGWEGEQGEEEGVCVSPCCNSTMRMAEMIRMAGTPLLVVVVGIIWPEE